MNDWLNFTGKVALVTGAASGMGLATARAFAEAGAAVVLADVREGLVQTVAEELVADGHRAIGVACDVSDDAQVAAMVDRAVSTFGRLDAAFNNAGVMASIAPTADSTREDWDRVININLRGVWSCMKYELPQMVRQGGGAIVNCSSVGGFTGNPGIASYIASKHGVIGLTRTTALEYVRKGIRVNAVCPGAIDTQIARDVVGGNEEAYEEMAKAIPLGRIGLAAISVAACTSASTSTPPPSTIPSAPPAPSAAPVSTSTPPPSAVPATATSAPATPSMPPASASETPAEAAEQVVGTVVPFSAGSTSEVTVEVVP